LKLEAGNLEKQTRKDKRSAELAKIHIMVTR
jgi:hypothetical protein